MAQTSTAPHAVLYDADCGFCTRSLGRILRWDRERRLRAVPIQSEEGDRLLASIPAAERLDSWHLAAPDGTVTSAGAAAPPLLRLLPGGALPAALLAAVPALTGAAYGLVARNRELLGRFLVLALVLVLAGCGSTVQEGSKLTVYASLPLSGPEAPVGRDLAAGMERALEAAGGEAGGAPVELEVLDDSESRGWTQAQIGENARTATQDSTAIAYLGEAQSRATLVSAPIVNESGMLHLSPGPVAPELLAEAGGDAVPSMFQPTGERTLGTLIAEGEQLERGAAQFTGEEAMALVLDSIERSEDPLDRATVLEAFYATTSRESPLGTYTIDSTGQAAYAGP